MLETALLTDDDDQIFLEMCKTKYPSGECLTHLFTEGFEFQTWRHFCFSYEAVYGAQAVKSSYKAFIDGEEAMEG